MRRALARRRRSRGNGRAQTNISALRRWIGAATKSLCLGV
jgi:hypothetical protein